MGNGVLQCVSSANIKKRVSPNILSSQWHLRLATTGVRIRLEVALIKVVGVKMMALHPFPGKALTREGARAVITSGAVGVQCRHAMAFCTLSSTLAEFLNSQQPALLADGTVQATDRQAALLEDLYASFCSNTTEQVYLLQHQFRKAQLLGAVSHSAPKPAVLCMTWQRKDISSLSRKWTHPVRLLLWI